MNSLSQSMRQSRKQYLLTLLQNNIDVIPLFDNGNELQPTEERKINDWRNPLFKNIEYLMELPAYGILIKNDEWFVLDIDIKHKTKEEISAVKYFFNNIFSIHPSFFVSTKSGGMHVYYKHTETSRQQFAGYKNSQKFIQKCDDVIVSFDLRNIHYIVGPYTEFRGQFYTIPENQEYDINTLQPIPDSFFDLYKPAQSKPKSNGLTLTHFKKTHDGPNIKIELKDLLIDAPENSFEYVDDYKNSIVFLLNHINTNDHLSVRSEWFKFINVLNEMYLTRLTIDHISKQCPQYAATNNDKEYINAFENKERDHHHINMLISIFVNDTAQNIPIDENLTKQYISDFTKNVPPFHYLTPVINVLIRKIYSDRIFVVSADKSYFLQRRSVLVNINQKNNYTTNETYVTFTNKRDVINDALNSCQNIHIKFGKGDKRSKSEIKIQTEKINIIERFIDLSDIRMIKHIGMFTDPPNRPDVLNTFSGFQFDKNINNISESKINEDIERLKYHALNIMCNKNNDAYNLLGKFLYNITQLKLNEFIMVFTGKQRSGKNIFFDKIQEFIGTQMTSEISDENMLIHFNKSVLFGKCLIVLNEALIKKSAVTKNLKNFMTVPELILSEKFQTNIKTANHCNFVITTNEYNPINVERSNGRVFVQEVSSSKINDLEYFKEFANIDPYSVKIFIESFAAIEVNKYDIINNEQSSMTEDLKIASFKNIDLWLYELLIDNQNNEITKLKKEWFNDYITFLNNHPYSRTLGFKAFCKIANELFDTVRTGQNGDIRKYKYNKTKILGYLSISDPDTYAN